MNINPISFKGTYCIPIDTFKVRSSQKLISKTDEYELIFETGSYDNKTTIFMHAPYELDEKAEKLLKRLRIPHTIMDEGKALNPNNIKSRIVMSDGEEMSVNYLIEIDTEKLDKELKKNPDLYVGYKGRNGSVYKYERFKRYLKTNQPINATSIYLKRNPDGSVATYVENGRHRFAVLRDMGIESIPISIRKDSVNLAKEINLI